MQKVFENIIKALAEKRDEAEKNMELSDVLSEVNSYGGMFDALDKAIEIINQTAAEYNNGWIPCSERLPPVETEVFIVAKRKYRGGEVRYITTTAMYEDGTVLENDSCWRWEDIDGEWDGENDCYIIPEGWWENRHYNPDEVYNNVIDDEVIAWQQIPEPYKERGSR